LSHLVLTLDLISLCFLESHQEDVMPSISRISTATLFAVILTLLLTGTVLGQASRNLSGDISGILFRDTAYHVVGFVTVPVGQTLVIQSGTKVVFDGLFNITVNGVILANGAQSDSIVFTSNKPIPNYTDYYGINIYGVHDSLSSISYCKFEYAGNAIECRNGSSPRIAHNRFFITHLPIFIESANPIIEQNLLQLSEWFCIGITGPSIVSIIDNTINTTERDGIVVGSNATATIRNNDISHCVLSAVYASGSNSILIERNVISECSHGVYYSGGGALNIHKNIIRKCSGTGINCAALASITYNTFVENGIAIDCSSPTVTIEGNIISSSLQYGITNAQGVGFGYNDFHANVSNFLNPPTGAGVPITFNGNGDTADAYFNIFQNPDFYNAPAGDYRLNYSSHLINAGDPSDPKDPDSTIADIGALSFVPLPPIAQFMSSPKDGPAPLQVTFINKTLGYVSQHQWVFGDGETSSLESPTHLYDSAGVFFVKYRATNIVGSDSAYDTIVVSDASPHILSVRDIGSDQGGQVRLKWVKSLFDDPLAPVISSYSIFRKSSTNTSLRVGSILVGHGVVSDSTLLGFDFVSNVPALQLPEYQTVVPTLVDSTSTAGFWNTFLVVAHSTSLGVYYVSPPDSGYSVDNLAPIPPSGLDILVLANAKVQLNWDSPAESDVGHYEIFRSAISGFAPESGLKIGESHSTSFVDESPVAGISLYYRVIAVDVHDNRSHPSAELFVNVSVNVSCDVNQRWNLVSVPLTVGDYTKTVLFPTSASSAFAYQGGYTAWGTLENRRGYWLKFAEAQQVHFSGLLRNSDTVNVVPGWNLIGSISEAISTSVIGSLPPAIATSPFYRYNTGYSVAESIIPGNGYWVKVNQAGQLLLSSDVPPDSRIQITMTDEMPPAPPDEAMFEAGAMPTEFSLDQNYPNPFNPVTTIHYAIPVSSHVSIKVYNILGQEMATVVDESQEAGFKSLTFDASSVTSGVYYYRIVAGEFTQVKRMVLMR
jgi:PKD repeat protein